MRRIRNPQFSRRCDYCRRPAALRVENAGDGAVAFLCTEHRHLMLTAAAQRRQLAELRAWQLSHLSS